MNDVGLKVEIVAIDKVSYSLIHNGIRIINFIKFTNNSENIFQNLTVNVKFEPCFAENFTFGVSFIDRNQTIVEDELNLPVNFDYLYNLTESFKANIIVEVVSNNEIIAKEIKQIEVLTFDQWDGDRIAPQFLASFVLPNDSNIAKIAKDAESILVSRGDVVSFSGYKNNDKNIVLKQVGACYYALQNLGITYALPKPNFEKEGQKIRLPQEIITTKFSTCLDTSILFCSVLEFIGLNPVLIMISGHAYLGVWLEDDNFPNVIIEDKSFIENRVNNQAMILIEATYLTSKYRSSFEEAVNEGKHNLNKSTKTFYAVDIRSARASEIKPLPVSVNIDGKYILDKSQSLSNSSISLNFKVDDVRLINEKVDKNRFDTWEKRLLDLSSRNKLVSFIPNNQYFQIFAYDISRFFNQIYHEDLTIYAEKSETQKEERGKIFDLNFASNGAIYQNDFENQRVRLLVTEKSLPKIINNLKNAAKNSLEESGSNTLFISVGTLIYEEKGKQKYAPILLIPVDINKNSRANSYDLSYRDDEILVNNTLFEYLKINFDIDTDELRKIPYDERTDTYDVKSYLDTLRDKISNRRGFLVSESSFIGIFSFTRFIMWNDIRNRKDDLLKNGIVRALVDPSSPFKNEVEPANINELDTLIEPDKYAMPLMADASQTLAIVDAARGLSFVLNGPPGTGKSQTITNMIINSLYNGKSVLFVAQKMAALEVVKKRLDETGLGIFCIELHSNKAQKSDVLAQIRKIIDTGKLKKPEEYEEVCKKLLARRNELNEDLKKLHKVSENGFDLYDNILVYEYYKDDFKDIKLEGLDYKNITAESYNECIEELEHFFAIKKEIGIKNIRLFNPFKLNTYSITLRSDLKNTLEQYKSSLVNYEPLFKEFKSALNNNIEMTHDNLIYLYNCVKSYKENRNDLYKNYVLNYDPTNKNRITSILSEIDKNKANYEFYKKEFDESFIKADFANLIFRLDRSEGLSFFAKRKERKAIVKEVANHSYKPKNINQKNIREVLNNMKSLQEATNLLDKNKEMLTRVLAEDYLEFNTDSSKVTSKLEKTDSFRKAYEVLQASNKFELLEYIYVHCLDRYFALYLNNEAIEKKLVKEFKLDFRCLKFSNFFAEMNDFVSEVIKNIEKLKEYVLYFSEEEKASKMNFGNLLKLNLLGIIKDNEAINFYKKEVNYALAMDKISKDNDLNLFNGVKENDAIESYRKLIKEYNELTIKEVAARLSKSSTSFFSGENPKLSEEYVTLNKAISNNGRGISLRNLFDSIPNIIHLLCPCFLMSPLSVAQYLDPKNEQFDIVIFDEASQITTSDAVGAIARGKSAVIVGDEKQLPPTSFFQATSADEEDFFTSDGESVLMDCLNISLPKRYLSWHYRSKDESLIAFSNAEYYENNLLTFPSPNNLNGAITYKFVSNGVYENRRNKIEAIAVVNEISRRLKDPILSKKSVGVVTFSISQQGLISDLLQEALRNDHELEKAYYGAEEEIFIKNLENVQGDERDVIIFSICYGPNKEGRVSLNFGPLSTVGGEKRLNVAVSRAREEMVVFTSLRSEAIDLSRVQNKGSKGLKEFLEYAQNGKSYILLKNGDQKEYKDGIERFIASDLEKRGYECKINVGTSDFRVDIGVIDKNNKDKFSLGILCDSRSYLSSKTAKDRNITQKAVLNRLGWKIIRIWSLDYFDSPNYVVDKIVEAINDPNFDTKQSDSSIPKITFEKDEGAREFNRHSKEYISYKLPKKSEDSENFYIFLNEVRNVCGFFIKNEGPISYKVLTKKVLDYYNIIKNTNRTKDVFNRVLSTFKVTYTGMIPFYWSDEVAYRNFDSYRTSSDAREFSDISKEEILNAIKDIMRQRLSLTETELIKEISTSFGFNKISDTIKVVCGIALPYAVEQGVVKTNDDKTVYYFVDKKN